MADQIRTVENVTTVSSEANKLFLGTTENGNCNGAASNGSSTGDERVKSDDTPATSVNSVEEPAAAPSEEPNAMEILNSAMQHLAAGKRNLLVADTKAAVASLALACELLGTHYGETAVECGEAYFYYGKALLELARLEAGVIGNLDDGKSEENSMEEDNGEVGTPPEESPVDEKESIENESGSEDEEGSAAEDQGDSDGEEDPSNLQLAWEMLELAKTILIKQAESISIVDSENLKDAEEKTKLKYDVEGRISDTFQTLGELSIENENYTQAIEDLETCLKRRQNEVAEDSRCIAETHYQLGVARGFGLEFDEGVASYEGAINVLQIRIDRLKAKTESVDPYKEKDALYSRENEIKELESLIPEIKDKIADTKDMKAEIVKKLGDKRVMEEGIAANLGSSGDGSLDVDSNSAEVSTISSNLIKRPAQDSAAPCDAKKQHVEGDASA